MPRNIEPLFPPYRDGANPDLLKLIPANARIVLDVGCGTGALALAYRPLNDKARFLGIERDPHAVAVARTRMDAVSEVDVEANPQPFELPERVDCIVYGDVLQHLRDPWKVVRQQLKLLRADGVVLICIPNVEHWSLSARLFRGRWNYEAAGLLDTAHLRWFTLHNARRELQRLGLEVTVVTERVFEPESARDFQKELVPALHNLGIQFAEYERRATPLQYVLRCTPGVIQGTKPHAAGDAVASNFPVSETHIVKPAQTLDKYGVIFDIGASEGNDSAYYLQKGFRVVGVEADPEMCDHLRARFHREIANGSMTIVNRALACTRF